MGVGVGLSPGDGVALALGLADGVGTSLGDGLLLEDRLGDGVGEGRFDGDGEAGTAEGVRAGAGVVGALTGT